jgi:hypothetical protein
MGLFKRNKGFLLGALIFGLLIYVYFNYIRSTEPTTPLTTSAESVASPDLLATLSHLHTITLSDSIFSDPVFLSLTDFGVEIPPQNVGRPNPFAPLGSVKRATTTPQ